MSNIQLSNYVDECEVKSDKILTELNAVNLNMSIKHNYIIISVDIYNILEHNKKFTPSEVTSWCKLFESEHIIMMGTVDEFDCYVDIYLPPNKILISWDKQTSRDVKLNSLLNDTHEKEKIIKVIQ